MSRSPNKEPKASIRWNYDDVPSEEAETLCIQEYALESASIQRLKTETQKAIKAAELSQVAALKAGQPIRSYFPETDERLNQTLGSNLLRVR